MKRSYSDSVTMILTNSDKKHIPVPNTKSVQLNELHAFAYCLLFCFLIGIISLPQNQHYLSMSNLRTRVAIISQIRK